MTEIRTNENQAIIDTVLKLADLKPATGLPDGHHVLFAPHGFAKVDLTAEIDKRTEERAAGPRRIKGTEVAETLDGFIELVKRHSMTSSAIFAKGGDSPSFVAVIDYHGASTDTAGPVSAWREQRVTYGFPFTDSFRAWARIGWTMKKDFLQFVRDNALDIVDPSEVEAGAGTVTRSVFEAVLRAQGKPKAEREKAPLEALFGSPSALLDGATRLAAITSKSFEETDHGLGGIEVKFAKEDKVTGSEKVKEFYLVELEVFPGAQKTIIPARLKTKVQEGALFLTLELLGVKEMIEAAFQEAIRKVEGYTTRPVYRAALA